VIKRMYMDGVVYFMQYITAGRDTTIPQMPLEIRELIWKACYPICTMRCNTCKKDLLHKDTMGMLSVQSQYYFIRDSPECSTCLTNRRREISSQPHPPEQCGTCVML